MRSSVGVAILAAGKGTRLKSNIPKAIYPLLGKGMIDFGIQEMMSFLDLNGLAHHITAVVGHQKELVENHIKSQFTQVQFALQEQQKGTADAVRCYFANNSENWKHEYTLICCADTPLLKADHFGRLYSLFENDKQLEGVVATFKTEDPHGYGRIVNNPNSLGLHIVEEKDATAEERKINEVNSGLYLFKTAFLKQHLDEIDNKNKSGEFYLTDLFQDESKLQSVCFDDFYAFQGVNNLAQLAEVERNLIGELIYRHQLNGVRFILPESTYIEADVQITAGAIIGPNCSLQGKTQVEADVILEQGVVLKDSLVKKAAKILAGSYCEKVIVGEDCQVGPMARLREGTFLGANCKIGNFVETKKANLGDDVKVSHLSYVGDASIGARTNIGCGFITCNYDGANKHQTIIGEDSFIGSDCQMIAPVEIGDRAYIGSGSTINKNVPSEAFAIARQRQTNKEGMAKKFLKIKDK